MAAQSANVTIDGYPFVCVPLSDADFSDVAAVYVILCVSEGGSWTVLDVGQTSQISSRIDSHERTKSWLDNCPNKNIWVCVYPMPEKEHTKEDRCDVERNLRQQYKPPCGKR